MSEKVEKSKRETTAGLVPWGPIAAVLVSFGIYIGAQFIGAALVAIAPVLRGWSEKHIKLWFTTTTIGQFLLMLSFAAVSFLMLLAFLKMRKSGFRALGLLRPKLRDAGYAIVGLGLYIPLFIAVTVGLSQLLPGLNVDQEQQIGFENVAGMPELALVFISLVVLPPLIEEILMRGFLYSGLRQKFKKWPSALITSALFAVAHLQFGSGAPLLWIAAIDTFILSLVLIYLRELTGSLWASIGLHALKNGVAFAALFILKVG
jgi:membrane protease YdiL (CAAX protease family)